MYKNFRDKELSNLSEVAKNNVNNNDSNDSLKLEVYKMSPKIYRASFQKIQILNNYKPFFN